MILLLCSTPQLALTIMSLLKVSRDCWRCFIIVMVKKVTNKLPFHHSQCHTLPTAQCRNQWLLTVFDTTNDVKVTGDCHHQSLLSLQCQTLPTAQSGNQWLPTVFDTTNNEKVTGDCYQSPCHHCHVKHFQQYRAEISDCQQCLTRLMMKRLLLSVTFSSLQCQTLPTEQSGNQRPLADND